MLDKDQVKSVKVTDSQLKVTPKNEGNPFLQDNIYGTENQWRL